MTRPVDLHAAAALHFRLLARDDSSGQAELLALVHGVLADEETIDADTDREHPIDPCRSAAQLLTALPILTAG